MAPTLMLVLDANSLRPTKPNFINIMCGNELEEFAENSNKTKDVQTFYYERLVEFVSAFRHSCAKNIEFRCIIYISTRGVFSETIEQIVRDSKTAFRPEIVYGQSCLFSEIGICADRNPCLIRVYSKEKLIVSKDFEEYFNRKFGGSSINRCTWNEFCMDALEENVKLVDKLKPRITTASLRSSYSEAKTQSTSNRSSNSSSSAVSTHSFGSSQTKASSNYGDGTQLSIVYEEDEKRLDDDESVKDDRKFIPHYYEQFNQPFYVECMNEILIKLQNHFNNKDNQEATSFYKTFQNLVVQQVGKLSKEKKFNLKDNDKTLFACYLRDDLVSK